MVWKSARARIRATPNDSPPPGIPNGWSTPAALYIVSVPIATNSPVAPIIGIPTSFAISPPLPGGLSMIATNGQIYGTPTTPSTNTAYNIITTFVGGKTSTNTISIEVRNPFVSYGDSPKTWATNRDQSLPALCALAAHSCTARHLRTTSSVPPSQRA